MMPGITLAKLAYDTIELLDNLTISHQFEIDGAINDVAWYQIRLPACKFKLESKSIARNAVTICGT
jgi:hypothetical protein